MINEKLKSSKRHQKLIPQNHRSGTPDIPVLIKPSIMQSLGLDPLSAYPCFDIDAPQPRRVRRSTNDKRKSKLAKAARRKNRK